MASFTWPTQGGGSAGLPAYFFGDGSDGSAVLDGVNTYPWASLSGSTYTIIRQQNLVNLTINTGIIVVPNGYILTGTGSLSNAGTIDQSGKAGDPGNSIGANGGLTAGVAVGGISATDLADASAGQTGGNSTTGAGGDGNIQQISALFPPWSGMDGGTAGAGGTGSAGAGGASAAGRLSASHYLFKRVTQNFTTLGTSYISLALPYTIGCANGGAGAGGGGGDSVNNGGGGGAGGGGGGVLAAFFGSIANSGTMTVNGGAGGAGETPAAGNCGGGGGGAGGDAGMIYLLANSFSGSGAFHAVGGAGGAKGLKHGTGTDGTAGTAGANGVVLKYNGTTGAWI